MLERINIKNPLGVYSFERASIFLALLCLFLSVKFVIFSFFSAILIMQHSGQLFYAFKKIVIFLAIVLTLILYSLYLGNDAQYPLMEGRDIIICFATVILLNAISMKPRTPNFIISKIIILATLVGILKLGMVLYSIKTGISASLLVKSLSDITGWQLMTYSLEDSSVSRIQFPIDLASCFIIYFQANKTLNKINLRNVIILALIVFSVLMTMSRVFWFIGLVMAMLSFAQNIKKKTSLITIPILILGITIAYIMTYETTNKIIETRLDSNTNSSSDDVRKFQYRILSEKFFDAPILGQGLGYFIPEYRDGKGKSKYSYESQVLAMFMKTGILGFSVILMLIVYLCFSFEKTKDKWLFFTRSVFVMLWFLSGMFNPLLFSVPGGISLYLASNISSAKFNNKISANDN